MTDNTEEILKNDMQLIILLPVLSRTNHTKAKIKSEIVDYLLSKVFTNLPENVYFHHHNDDELCLLIILAFIQEINQHYKILSDVLGMSYRIHINEVGKSSLEFSIDKSIISIYVTASETLIIPSIFELIKMINASKSHSQNLVILFPFDKNSVLFTPYCELNYIMHCENSTNISAIGINCNSLKVFDIPLIKAHHFVKIKRLPLNSAIYIIFFENGYPLLYKLVYTGPEFPEFLKDIYDESLQKPNQYSSLSQDFLKIESSNMRPNPIMVEYPSTSILKFRYLDCIWEGKYQTYGLSLSDYKPKNQFEVFGIDPENSLFKFWVKSKNKYCLFFLSRDTVKLKPLFSVDKSENESTFILHKFRDKKEHTVNKLESFTENCELYIFSFVASFLKEKLKSNEKSYKSLNLLYRLYTKSINIPISLNSTIFSQAGLQRNDLLVFRSEFDHPMTVPSKHLNAIFKHKSMDIQYQANIEDLNSDHAYLKWSPTVKGFYKLYVNNHLIKSTKPIYVGPGSVSPEHCSLKSLTELFQMETSRSFVNISDRFGNTYSPCDFEDVEPSPQVIPNQWACHINASSHSREQDSQVFKNEMQITSKFSIKASLIGNFDKKYPVDLKFSHDLGKIILLLEVKDSSTYAILKVTINNIDLANSPIEINVKPMRFEVKRELFYKKLKALPGYNNKHNLNVNRTQLLESLLMNYNENIESLRGSIYVI